MSAQSKLAFRNKKTLGNGQGSGIVEFQPSVHTKCGELHLMRTNDPMIQDVITINHKFILIYQQFE